VTAPDFIQRIDIAKKYPNLATLAKSNLNSEESALLANAALLFPRQALDS